jgi:DNA-binding transcriptional MerR regulator
VRDGVLRSGELARLTGVSTDTLRVYEKRGLLARPRRASNGYREYPPEAALRVRLVKRALAIGFTLEELRQVLNVRDHGGAPCREVRRIAARRLESLTARIEELQSARERLSKIVERWDEILAATPQGARALLLEALEPLVGAGDGSPLVPPALRRGGRTR